MKPKIKKKWIEDLRSGKFEQGKHNLRSVDDKYCCLGVLCDIYVREQDEDDERNNWSKYYADTDTYSVDGRTSFPSPKILEWAGLNKGTVTLDINGEPVEIIDLNDVEGYSFEQLADLIEEQY